MARLLSERMVGLGWFSIAIKVETNMIFFNITDPDCNGAELTAFLKSNGVLCSLKSGVVNRFVIHHYIREK
jgi:threonine aldolase